jgi:dTMP kinase
MTRIRYYGIGNIPGFDRSELPGRLIVLEGTDGVGRSTQVALLHEWLEANGYAVTQTGLARSSLVGPGLERAKQGHTSRTAWRKRSSQHYEPALSASRIGISIP